MHDIWNKIEYILLKKMQFKSDKRQKLEAIAKRHPKQYWKSIKSCYNKPNKSWN